MRKAFILVAMCLCALPVIMARSMSEEELLATRMLLDVPTAAMSVEEQMIMESGMYGSGSMGGYGGVLTPVDTPTSSPTDAPQQTESGAITPESAPSAASTTASPAPVPAQKTASSASATQLSLMAGAVTAVAVLLL